MKYSFKTSANTTGNIWWLCEWEEMEKQFIEQDAQAGWRKNVQAGDKRATPDDEAEVAGPPPTVGRCSLEGCTCPPIRWFLQVGQHVSHGLEELGRPL